MLVLGRKQNERIVIGDNIVITVLERRNGLTRLGIEAPHGVVVMREEMLTSSQLADVLERANDGRQRKGDAA